jgi:hypothetical protein
MKAIQLTHSFFPTGRGLVIINKEIILLYADGDAFTIVHTDEPYKGLDEMQVFLSAPDLSQEMRHTGTMAELLAPMPNDMLGAIYEEVCGYDPFEDDPSAENADEHRDLVVEYMSMPEVIKQVF